MRIGPVARGLLSYVPVLDGLLPSKTGGGHADSARYCYGVWLKHLTLLHANGLPAIPRTVAELGPGESLGVGLCALLSGADHYAGLDVIAHSNPASNQQILEALIPLFEERAPNPDKGWPEFNFHLDARLFPSHILSEEILRRALQPGRIDAIRRAVTAPAPHEPITAAYKAPWLDPHVIEEGTVDLVVSHSVLEHVVDLPATYAALYRWVKPGGWMSHQIDFKSHGLSTRWNGYRTCSERLWEITLGKRVFMINREPASVHLRLMEGAGFRVVTVQKFMRTDGIRRDELAARWADLPDEDLNCSGMYVIATK